MEAYRLLSPIIPSRLLTVGTLEREFSHEPMLCFVAYTIHCLPEALEAYAHESVTIRRAARFVDQSTDITAPRPRASRLLPSLESSGSSGTSRYVQDAM